jgi:hypothetical protein
MNKLLEIVEDKRPHHVWGLTREDGMLISVSNYLENIPTMISEEYCQAKVELTKVVFNKQPQDYTVTAKVFEDDGDFNEQDFTLSSVAFYN